MIRRLTITFTAAERAALERMAQQDTRPVKDQVRALVRAEAERRNVWCNDPAGPAEASSPIRVMTVATAGGRAGEKPKSEWWLMRRPADEPVS